jgi:energy-coupling factor transporter ATP-binding protein EcfA2
VIQVQNLKKVFGPKFAVDRVSFAGKKGEVLGFLVPNDAGKSTTMRMITGFIPPSEGIVLSANTMEPHRPRRERSGDGGWARWLSPGARCPRARLGFFHVMLSEAKHLCLFPALLEGTEILHFAQIDTGVSRRAFPRTFPDSKFPQ